MKHITLLTIGLLALTSCDVANNLSKKIGIGKEADAKPAIVTTQPVVNETPAQAAIADDLNGEWTIIGVNDKEIQQDENMPYITFVNNEHRFYSSNGCNILNGNFTVKGDQITFAQVLATQKYCAEINYDSEINRVFADGNTVTAQVKAKGENTYLYLIDASGRTLMTLSRHNLGWLNGQWEVASLQGHIVDRSEANMFFDIASLRVHGNTGCNYFNGNLHIDPLQPGSINFSGMGVTRMACPDQDFERTMLVALEEVTSVQHKDGLAVLKDANDQTLITLKRAVEKGE